MKNKAKKNESIMDLILMNQKDRISDNAKEELFETLIITSFFENLADEAVEIDGIDTDKNWLKHYEKAAEQYADLIINHSLEESLENLSGGTIEEDKG